MFIFMYMFDMIYCMCLMLGCSGLFKLVMDGNGRLNPKLWHFFRRENERKLGLRPRSALTVWLSMG
jgi:hypothetical protein